MDEIRDIKKTDQLSRFLDGHLVRTNPFGRNATGEKAYRRAERLVAALHLLTAHISWDEPVRQMIRKTGLQLLANVLLQRDEMRIPGSSKSRNTQSSLREIISLMRMLTISGFVSVQNAEVVIEALDELGNFFTVSQKTPLSETVSLVREDLFGTGHLPQARNPASRGAPQAQTGVVRLTDKENKQSFKDSVKDKIADRRSLTGISPRAQFVLDTLRSHGELGIRDISSQLSEYSEKMIQRELAALVRDGKVKKAGLKRWSKYSLV